MCKISIIIPVYNSGELIIEAIESALSQTFPDYEIIVVDDGSTDSIKDRLKKYSGRIKYFFQNNQGPAAARNNGLKYSKGEYISFLDADDLWDKEYLNKTFNLINENKLDVVLTDYYADYYDSNDIFIKREYRYIANLVTDNNNKLYSQLFKRFQGGFEGTTAMLITKKCFEMVGRFDEKLRILEDWDLWLRIAKYNLKIGHLKEPLRIYRRYGNSECRNKNNFKLKFNNIYYAFEKNKKEAFFLNKSLKKSYSETFRMLGVDCILNRINFFLGLKFIFRGILDL